MIDRGFRGAGSWLAALALLAATGQGCGDTRPCRTGTIFLTVKAGNVDADHVVIQVATDGVSGTPTSLPLNGAKGGGVEVTFPAGYVENKSVSVTAWLEKNGAQVSSSQIASTRLAPGCSALEVQFDRGDAGRPDTSSASGGRGGADVPGSGGRGTGGGQGGNAGNAGSTGGTSGSGGAASGGAGAAASGGAAGRAAGGGAGGAVGGRGGAATGGRAAGGSGDAAAGGAGGRACVPTATVENCYNNLDDDCNGLADCADTAGCSPTSQCQAIDPTMGMVGASVAASAACPTGAPMQRALNSGLMASGCTGCSCLTGTAALTCSAQIYGYTSADTAAAMCAANTGGTLVATLTSAQACTTPNWGGTIGFVYGIRASMFAGTPSGTCTPGGTPTKGTPTWGSSTKFCGVPAVGGGCATGQVCVPKPVVAAGACLLMDGARACPTGLRASSWFTGFTDTRTCGACSCGAPTGGDCGSMLIGAGSDYSCPPSSVVGYVRTGDHLCLPAGTYSPGVQFSGTPVAPTCAAAAAVTGALTTSGPQTLCCI